MCDKLRLSVGPSPEVQRTLFFILTDEAACDTPRHLQSYSVRATGMLWDCKWREKCGSAKQARSHMNILELTLSMLVIFLLILCGGVLYRRQRLDDRGAKLLSFLVVNITNPAMLMDAAISNEEAVAPAVFLEALLVSVSSYAILILASYFLCFLLRVPARDRYVFQMLTVYGNIGFIGFPVCAAVLGRESLIYVAINCLVFNLLIYTYGDYVLQKAKSLRTGPQADADSKAAHAKRLRIINIGTMSAVVTVILYLLNPEVGRVLANTISYIGNATIFLSMLVLGCSVAAFSPRELFLGSRKMYLFLAIRMLLLPILMILVMKQFVSDRLLLGTMAVMLSLPGGNMPLMMAREKDLDGSELSRGIVLSTILCMITIPIVCLAL